MSTLLRLARTRVRDHPRTADAGLAMALLGAALASSKVTIDLFDDDPAYHAPDEAAVVALLCALVLPLAFRRRFPVAVLAVGTAAYVALGVALGPGLEQSFTAVVLSFAFYSAGAYGRRPASVWVAGMCVAALAGYVVYALDRVGGGVPALYVAFVIVGNSVLFCALWALGAALELGRRRAGELLDRTVELEREREENARRAVLEERVRIARELHDVVAHHVSMMGVQAGAARLVVDRDVAKAREALAAIETSSRAAVTELHRLLGFLRQAGDEDGLAPQPGLGELHRLAASLGGSHVTVEVRVEGSERTLPPTVDVSAYRIVQEALTNTVKHARASRAEVHLRYWPDELELEILDDGDGHAGGTGSATGGHGLIGMRERAILHGGQLTAGATADGGFRVQARLPAPAGAL